LGQKCSILYNFLKLFFQTTRNKVCKNPHISDTRTGQYSTPIRGVEVVASDSHKIVIGNLESRTAFRRRIVAGHSMAVWKPHQSYLRALVYRCDPFRIWARCVRTLGSSGTQHSCDASQPRPISNPIRGHKCARYL
jgi:hypothetical protein